MKNIMKSVQIPLSLWMQLKILSTEKEKPIYEIIEELFLDTRGRGS